jgi:hypothetical protein
MFTPLGCSILLPVDIVNCVQTLKGTAPLAALTINSSTTLMTPHNTEGHRRPRLTLFRPPLLYSALIFDRICARG